MELIEVANEMFNEKKIRIFGTKENPLFCAADIGNVLDMGNIHTSIAGYGNDKKGIHTMETRGGKQNITYLTTKGVYALLMKSRKPIAVQFQEWIYDVIDKIRTTGKYNLGKEVANDLNKKYEQQMKEIEEYKKIHGDEATNDIPKYQIPSDFHILKKNTKNIVKKIV